MARIAPSMVAPPAMSYFIFSMPSAGLMEIPPVSKVIALPTSPKTGFAGAPAGEYLRTIIAGGSSEPWATLQNAPIFSALMSSPSRISHSNPFSVAILRARLARIVGVSRLPGSFTSSRAKFCDSPMMRPSSIADRRSFSSLPAGATMVSDARL